MVKVYTLPSCPACMRTKAWLTAKQVEFEEIDLTSDGKVYAEVVIKRGFQSAPVVATADDVWWSGHDVEKLAAHV